MIHLDQLNEIRFEDDEVVDELILVADIVDLKIFFHSFDELLIKEGDQDE